MTPVPDGTIISDVTVTATDGSGTTTRTITYSNNTVSIEEVTNGTTGQANKAILISKARAAITANLVYSATLTPTVAQAVQQVGFLTKECTALIKLLIGALEDTSGT